MPNMCTALGRYILASSIVLQIIAKTASRKPATAT
jgi:hypothetical protein